MTGADCMVSVVIPAFRAAATIARAVESVLRQTFPVHEVIIVDDGGSEELAQALAPFADRVILLRMPHGGVARARNNGIERSVGTLVAFLDADDYWEPDKIERHVALYRAHPDLGLSFSDYYCQRPGSGGRTICGNSVAPAVRNHPARVSGPLVFDLAAAVSTITVVVPRAVLGRHRFREGLHTGEDRDLWVRLILEAPVCYLPEPLATAVLGTGSLSRANVDLDCLSMLEVVHAHAGLLGPAGVRRWEARVYRRWASDHLVGRRPAEAVAPALACLRRQPLSVETWWLVAKSLICMPLALCTARTRSRALEPGGTSPRQRPR